jgi:hypothetical protein
MNARIADDDDGHELFHCIHLEEGESSWYPFKKIKCVCPSQLTEKL